MQWLRDKSLIDRRKRNKKAWDLFKEYHRKHPEEYTPVYNDKEALKFEK